MDLLKCIVNLVFNLMPDKQLFSIIILYEPYFYFNPRVIKDLWDYLDHQGLLDPK